MVGVSVIKSYIATKLRFLNNSQRTVFHSLNELVSKERFFQLQLKTVVSKPPACKHWIISGVLPRVIATTVINHLSSHTISFRGSTSSAFKPSSID